MLQYDISCPTGKETIDSFNLYDTVWYFEGGYTPETTYLAVVVGRIRDEIVILRYVNGIWQRREVFPDRLSPRSQDFSTELFMERRVDISLGGLKFDLPEEWYNSFARTSRKI